MGDVCDQNDIDRFMRSTNGQAHLEEIRQMLKGRTVVDVEFSNEVHLIATTLHLDDGETFLVFQPSLEVGTLREQFEDVIEREYFKDFPERKPKET
jgi:hypothetical protein